MLPDIIPYIFIRAIVVIDAILIGIFIPVKKTFNITRISTQTVATLCTPTIRKLFTKILCSKRFEIES